MEAEDFEQDLIVDLLHRCRAFDPARSSFTTFADRIVRHRVSALLRPCVRLDGDRQTVSINSRSEEDAEGPALIETLQDDHPAVDDDVAVRVDIGRFMEGLSEPLRACCDILLSGSITDGAAAAGVNAGTKSASACRSNNASGGAVRWWRWGCLAAVGDQAWGVSSD
jgi:RNA polymerase sigma-70 factor (ECF subfamily)